MKFDKETLLKHRFWVLLSGVFPLIIIAIVVLMTVVVGSINADRKTIEEALNAAKPPVGEPRNEEFIKVMREIADELQAMQDGVWKEVYLPQKQLTEGYKAWPPSFNDMFHYHDGLFAKKIQVFRNIKPPEAPGDGKFQGVIEEMHRDYIFVNGAGSEFKTSEPRKFHRSANVRVTLADENKPMLYFDMRKNDRVLITYQRGKYFNDPLTDTEREHYPRQYRELIPEIVEQVEPVTAEKGEGVVQFINWLPKKGERIPPPTSPFFRNVPQELWQANVTKDFSNDAWIAQEDLWIHREMFRLVRQANDYVSRFTYKSGVGDGVSPYICSNPYWQLELKLDKDKEELEVKATNLTAQRQSLDVTFWINFTAKDAEQESKKMSAAEWGEYRLKNFEPVYVGGEPVNPVTFKDNFQVVKKQLPPGPRRTQIYGVEQVLNWKTAAVKRIDAVDIAHSHRTIVKGLKPLKEKPPEAVIPDPNLALQPPFARQRISEFGLTIDRYCEVTPQARRVPVAITLIVDQQHTNRVLAAFANSDLRLVITQVLHNNCPDRVRPAIVEQGKGAVVGFSPLHGEGASPFGRPQPGAAEEQETNVEMVIYGIISLYERHPPRILDPDDIVPQVAAPGAPTPTQ